MKLKYIYVGVVLAISYITIYGFVLPLLISTKSTIAVGLGILLIVASVMLPITYFFNKANKKEEKK